MNISEIDVNFSICEIPKNIDLCYHCLTENPFKIHGLISEDGVFRRVPYSVAKGISEDIEFLSCHAAGGRLTFETDADTVALIASLRKISKMPHFTTIGSCGFDLYVDNEYYKSLFPPYNVENGYSACIQFPDRRMRKIMINFPLYSEVADLKIGLPGDAAIKEYNPYKKLAPIVYYGSSITQGGCACKPSNAYQFVISQRQGIDFLNLGFSGSAKGEKEMADYIATLDMSVFVMDYDHNSNSPEELKRTHESFYRIVRKAKKDLPIILISRPDYHFTADDKARKEVVYKTYRNALTNGENVYFIDGESFYESCDRGMCTVDGTHPNDLGLYLMAGKINAVISEIFK